MTSKQNLKAAHGASARRWSSIRRLFHRSAAALLGLCVSPAANLLGQTERTSSANEDTLVYWPRLDFVIPFNVDVTGQAPREIQLEVSDNGGRSWKLNSSADVRTKQFQFNAKSDGEYQFRLKTLDSQGRSFDNPGEPLRILVDTKKPEGKLVVDIDQRGVMQAEFEIVDLALDVSTIQLAYQTEELAELSQWRDIPIDLSTGQNPAELFGSGSWSIPNGTRNLVVRLLAKDKAGNPLEITRLPQLPRSASRGAGLQLASGKARDNANAIRPNPAIGSGVSEAANDSFPKVEVLGPTRALTKLDPVISSQLAAKDQVIEMQSKLIAQQQSATRQSQEDISSRQFTARSESTERLVQQNKALPITDVRPSKLPVRTLTDEDLEKFKASSPMTLAGKRTESVLKTEDLQMRSPSSANGPMNSANGSMQLDPKVNRIPGQTAFQRDIQRLYSNSKAFSLDYHVDNDPDSPVAAVELWGTTDQGQTWSLWGQDPDRESPFDIEVETEGLFGFRMVIVGANGLASNRPRNGDNADAWIHVDVQNPQVKLVSALYGKGKESGSMVIEYRAEDDFFTDRPITLQYSQNPNGPWINIVFGARNNGRYVWAADPSLPPTIYLRIEAYDAAGNISVNQLDLPVDVEGLAPRGRIQGFRPIK
jgi:hypothetical protein